MYTTSRNLTIFGVILGAANILMSAVLAFIFVPDFKMSWAFEFAATIFLIANAIGVMLMTIGLRSLTSDLAVSDEANATQIKALKNRIEELERKVQY